MHRSAIHGVYGNTSAIKVVKEEMPLEEHENFIEEVFILASLFHNNNVGFRGTCTLEGCPSW